MASCGRRKSKMDLISELPGDVKERILERLDIRDAAKHALLSSHWNKVWLSHGRLVFDGSFFECIPFLGGDEALFGVNIINNILLRRTGPIKKFTLDTYQADPQPEQSDIDWWCLFLSRNGVQELNLSVPGSVGYKLPSCIVSCQTMKKLVLTGFIFDCPINDRCIFPGVTSLLFHDVKFGDNVNGVAYGIPNLEKLVIGGGCDGMLNFEINAPKLECFCVTGYTNVIESEWFRLHFKSIKTLSLFTELFENVELATFPTAINLQVMKLFCCEKELTIAMQLLVKSPNLRILEIAAADDLYFSDDDMEEAASRILEDPNGCIIDLDLKMLHTIKIDSFRGSIIEMLFVKILLSKSPALERLVIGESCDMDTSMAVKILRELSHFPRASPKAQLFRAGYDSFLTHSKDDLKFDAKVEGLSSSTCHCGQALKICTSWMDDDPGRRFWNCAAENEGFIGGCGFVRWFDPPMCESSKIIIPEGRSIAQK